MAEKPSEKTSEQRLWEIAILAAIWFAVFHVRSGWLLYLIVGALFGLMLTRSVLEEAAWVRERNGSRATAIMIGTVLVGVLLWPVLPFVVLGRKLYKFLKGEKND